MFKKFLSLFKRKKKTKPDNFPSYYGQTPITGEMIEEFRAARRATIWQPPKGE